jgi:deoxyribodipyrimidine photo-lyase
MNTSLVWFKNDLRLHDNEMLCNAIANSDAVICCYCVEPNLFKKLNLGFRKADINRFKFLEQAVLDLQKRLEEINGHLIIKQKGALIDIPEMVEKYEITSIYAESEYASEEINLQNQLKLKLPKTNFNFSWGKTLYHKDDIPFEISAIPLTSKAYRIPTSKESKPRETFKAPVNVNSYPDIPSNHFPSYKKFGFDDESYKKSNPFLKGGESEALKRLEYYFTESELLTSYRWTRNKSLGLDYSSKFSPYLALGCISPRFIYEKVKEYEINIKKNQSTWWLVFELVWRDYFTFKGMRFRNEIFKTKGFKNKDVNWGNNKNYFEKWKTGTTGIPFIDAHIRQLNETGYMSNRGRVNCASYLIHDLKINWTRGAAYFESQLIDYDVSANWLNWHVQAFEIYYTNPVHQSLKYKANEYIAKWIPELKNISDDKIHAPWLFDLNESLNYPKPIEVHKKWIRATNNILKSVEN